MAEGATAYGDISLLNLASGQRQLLPRSPAALAASERLDAWSTASGTVAPLVRVDANGQVNVYERSSLQRTGGFTLSSLPQANLPELWSPLLPSPDGRYLLAYWKRSYLQDAPVLVVFDLQGNVLKSGSPFAYDRFLSRSAVDWLPDGRYVYLAGDNVAVGSVNEADAIVGALTLPRGVSTDGARVQASPDGTRLLLQLGSNITRASGVTTTHTLLYQAPLSGGAVRQVTALTPAVQGGLIDYHHVRAGWSPDGAHVVFGVSAVGAGSSTEVGWLVGPCSPVFVVPAISDALVIDPAHPPGSLTTPVSGTTPIQTCKSGLLRWVARP